MAKTPAQLVQERLALAAQAQAQGNAAAAAAYSQAAANIKGSGQAKVQAVADQYAAQAKAPAVQQDDKKPSGTTIVNNYAAPDNTAQNLYYESLNNQNRSSAVEFLKNMLTTYGMSGLAGSVDSLIAEWGNNTSVIANRIRETNDYKTRFKGLLALQQKGITDVQNEAEYINLESQYRAVFRDSGLQDFLGTAGSQPELDAIAKLATDYSVSVNEVKSRVADAQRVANDTAPEVKDALQRFYGVGPAQLVQYVLDPAKTTEQINRQVNAGLASGYAAKQNLNLDQSVSEQIANISGANDMSLPGLQGQLKNAADMAMSTKRLANIDNTSLTDSEIAQNEFNLSTDASQKIKKLQSSERAKFGGTSGIQTGSLSNNSGF